MDRNRDSATIAPALDLNFYPAMSYQPPGHSQLRRSLMLPSYADCELRSPVSGLFLRQ
jgi:hypothetical protein